MNTKPLLIGLFVICLTACGGKKQQEEKPGTSPAPTSTSKDTAPSDVVQVSALDLVKAYNANKSDADARYKDQLVAFKGEVVLTDINSNGAYVMVAERGPHGTVGVVTCYLLDPEDLSEHYKGEMVNVKGFVSGKKALVNLASCQVEAVYKNERNQVIAYIKDKAKYSDGRPISDEGAELMADKILAEESVREAFVPGAVREVGGHAAFLKRQIDLEISNGGYDQ